MEPSDEHLRSFRLWLWQHRSGRWATLAQTIRLVQEEIGIHENLLTYMEGLQENPAWGSLRTPASF